MLDIVFVIICSIKIDDIKNACANRGRKRGKKIKSKCGMSIDVCQYQMLYIFLCASVWSCANFESIHFDVLIFAYFLDYFPLRHIF